MTASSQTLLDAAVPHVRDGGPAVPAAAAASRVRIRVWDLPLRLFHWSLVAAVLTAVATGWIGGDWIVLHGQAGLAIVGLVTFRLVWGFVGSTHARFLGFLPTPRRIAAYLRGRWRGVGHNPLGALSVLALLGLLAAQAGTGLFANDDIAFSGPLASLVSETLSSRLTGLHHQLANVLLGLAGLHVLAIVFYVRVKKEPMLGPMLTGDKEVRHEQAEPARGGGWLALAVALAAAAVAVLLAAGVLLPSEPAPVPAAAPQAQPAAAW